jgi:hypothetical protein
MIFLPYQYLGLIISPYPYRYHKIQAYKSKLFHQVTNIKNKFYHLFYLYQFHKYHLNKHIQIQS